MKKKFYGYYPLTEEEFKDLWKNCVFSFDTCVLLNLYRYSKNTSDEFIKLLYSNSERIWIPYQVGLEYHRNRISVIYDQIPIYEDLIAKIEYQFTQFEQIVYKTVGKGRHPLIDSEGIVSKLSQVRDEIITTLKENRQNHPNLLQNDTILEEISGLFHDRIGEEYEIDRMREIIAEGKKRFPDEIPPGYKDLNEKPGNKQYGDLILWHQIIDYSKEIDKPIVFVIDDRKEDWWLKKSGKTLGPRPELLQEFYLTSGNRIYIYSSDRFMELAQQYLGNEVNEDSILEVQKLREHDERIDFLTTFSGAALQFPELGKATEGMGNDLLASASALHSSSVQRNFNEFVGSASLMNEAMSSLTPEEIRILENIHNHLDEATRPILYQNSLYDGLNLSSGIGKVDQSNGEGMQDDSGKSLKNNRSE